MNDLFTRLNKKLKNAKDNAHTYIPITVSDLEEIVNVLEQRLMNKREVNESETKSSVSKLPE